MNNYYDIIITRKLHVVTGILNFWTNYFRSIYIISHILLTMLIEKRKKLFIELFHTKTLQKDLQFNTK